MEENVSGKKSNAWLWIIIILIIAIVVLFFLFRSPSPEKEDIDTGKDKVTGGTGNSDIEALDVGENPDVGVDDFSSLEISNEEITG